MNDANTFDATEGALVLVVDDDNATRIMAGEYLRQSGFRVLEAEDGLEALEVLDTQTVDVIVLDVEMPRLDGFATCTQLRKRAQFTDTPVLMLTGLNDTDSIDLAFDAGATDFATKPINWSLLRHRLRYLLRAAKTKAEIQLSAERIHQLAYFDKLTRLPNREYLNEQLALAVEDARCEEGCASVLLIGLDDFKRINQGLGRVGGDALLVEVAQRLTVAIEACSPPNPGSLLLARIGGDEFVLMLRGQLNPDAAARVVQAALAKAFLPCGDPIHLTSSIGVSRFPEHADDAPSLLKCAETAMECAKREGRNIVRVHNDEMACHERRQYALDSALHQALSRQELAIHYQPQWCTQSGKLSGAEALLRWRSAEFGNVSPVEFIPLAEGNGQIIPIGDWVLESACEQAVSWQRSCHDLDRIAVNISAHQFVLPGFSRRVASVLERTGLAPASLELEITESVLASNVDLAISTLTELRQIGVQLSIDDFGTGYSSLSQLKLFPIDRLKIDRSFINGVTSDRSDQAITETILTLANRLDLSVVAEGVETEGQLAFLRDRNCTEVQGYLLSKPLPALDFDALLEKLRAESTSDECTNDEYPLLRTGTEG